jgi:hypothetical protein
MPAAEPGRIVYELQRAVFHDPVDCLDVLGARVRRVDSSTLGRPAV